jgi:hypothetical protein
MVTELKRVRVWQINLLLVDFLVVSSLENLAERRVQVSVEIWTEKFQFQVVRHIKTSAHSANEFFRQVILA